MKAILLKQMRTVEDRIVDIEVKDGIITAIGTDLKEHDHLVIDGKKECYISNGWIDIHTHCFDKYELYGDKIDEIGYPCGVTTVVDAGTCGADTIAEFIEQKNKAKTNAYAFLNIASCGIKYQDELSDLTHLEPEKTKAAFQQYPDTLIGLKARMSASVLGNSGITPLAFATRMGEDMKVPIMVHIGSRPASLEEILTLSRKGDLITHIFNPKANGILNPDDTIKSFVLSAKEKGIWFDIGHGKDSFSFHVCEVAKAHGILCDSISTDIYSRNRQHGPVYDMATTLDKLRACGYSLKEVIDRVTKAPASILKKPELGSLAVGCNGDLTLFHIVEKEKELVDSIGETRIISSVIQPHAVILHQDYLPCKEVNK